MSSISQIAPFALMLMGMGVICLVGIGLAVLDLLRLLIARLGKGDE